MMCGPLRVPAPPLNRSAQPPGRPKAGPAPSGGSAAASAASVGASSRGFTLLEVLVALAVVAIALLAAMRAAGGVADNAQRYRMTVLAEQCAQNFLVDQRLSKTFLSVGQSTSACTQANVPFTVAVDVMPTPNPNFRRVQVNVLDASGWSAWQVVTIIGNL
ncbi:MAG: type II secretion system minor pseudopilin GspI [Betaproteobacteria bacterium]|uniref:Type II secretion system protein I n=1 Tax=Thiomonas intermedia (strain K12) TaxID=75379 RepID=D5X6W9_THIK1|nr:type II secretion system minor pseudopilin GspI [Betaproteobacteria bacterium]MDE2269550.1 type II secretion system minor pseudopilin GspI [Betaproteobacteria bacterium]